MAMRYYFKDFLLLYRFSTLGGQIRYVPLKFLIKHICMPAVISFCLAIPWQQIAYHRKLEWRPYLVWISLLHCLIPHSIFHSVCLFFCKNILWLNIGTDKRIGVVFLKTHIIDFPKALWPAAPFPAFHLWAEMYSLLSKDPMTDGPLCVINMCSPYLVYC